MKRDETLDLLRGLAMSWVIFIHCFYWTNFFTSNTANIIKSLFLIEMPLFFFITGASYMVSSKKKYFEYIKNRGKRIFIPYWCYAIFCLIFAFLANATFQVGQFAFLFPKEIPNFGVPYLNSALWFLWPFLLVTITLPLFKFYFDKVKTAFLKFVPAILMLGSLFWLDHKPIFDFDLKSWLMYSFFSYLGFFYPVIKKQEKKIYLWITSIICFITLFVFWKLDIYPLDMQYNKFDYNMMFTIYNLTFLSVLGICIKLVVNILQTMKKQNFFTFLYAPYEKNSYTIFLFHPFAFLLINNILSHFECWAWIMYHQFFVFPFYFLSIWILSSIIGRIFSFIETSFWNKFYQKS